jgi:hypothetical protein
MGAKGTDTTILSYATSNVVPSVPITSAFWLRIDSSPVNPPYNYYALRYGNASNNTITWVPRSNGVYDYNFRRFGDADVSYNDGALKFDSWVHLCCVSRATNDHAMFLNGVLVGTSTQDQSGWGPGSTAYLNCATCQGTTAEVALWFGALSPPEIALLYAGVCPDEIQVESLRFYAPLRYDFRDVVMGLEPTVTGTVSIGEHPPVFPRRRHVFYGQALSGDISGSSSGVATVSGSLTGSGALAGSSAGAAAVSGTLTGSGELVGTSSGVATVSGTLTGSGALSGSSAGVATVSGTATGSGELAGSVSGIVTVTGTLTGSGALTGSSAGVATVSGTVIGAGALAGSSAGVATVSGAFETGRSVSRYSQSYYHPIRQYGSFSRGGTIVSWWAWAKFGDITT